MTLWDLKWPPVPLWPCVHPGCGGGDNGVCGGMGILLLCVAPNVPEGPQNVPKSLPVPCCHPMSIQDMTLGTAAHMAAEGSLPVPVTAKRPQGRLNMSPRGFCVSPRPPRCPKDMRMAVMLLQVGWPREHPVCPLMSLCPQDIRW